MRRRQTAAIVIMVGYRSTLQSRKTVAVGYGGLPPCLDRFQAGRLGYMTRPINSLMRVTCTHWGGGQGMAVELPHSAQLQPTRHVIWPIQMTEKLYFSPVTPTGGCPMTAPLAERGRCHARHGNWLGVFSTLLLNSPHLATLASTHAPDSPALSN